MVRAAVTLAIEWVGLPSIFDDPRFVYRRVAGLMTEQELRVLRVAASKRVYRVDGRIARRLGPKDLAGLSQHYQWGPQRGSYVQAVAPGDWRLIQQASCAREFREVRDGVPSTSARPLAVPTPDVLVVKEERFTDFRSFVRAMQRDAR